MLVEFVIASEDKETAQGVVEDILDEQFGAENYSTFSINEMTEDQIIEHDTGIHDEDDDPTEQEIVSALPLDPETQKILDGIELNRLEQIEDELG